jgi:hypothetical protein
VLLFLVQQAICQLKSLLWRRFVIVVADVTDSANKIRWQLIFSAVVDAF